MKISPTYGGIFIAFLVISLWFIVLISLLLYVPIDFSNPLFYLGILIQTHLYTGVFITAHDAMHGTVAPEHKRLNTAIGVVCSTLFMWNNYHQLRTKHRLHHLHAGTEGDPDYALNNQFFVWFFSFAKQYISFWQVLLISCSYFLAGFVFSTPLLMVYSAVPAILSTFQLFYFGTYLPHRGEHDDADPHRARSAPLNHIAAFLACYFFGYHHEHHELPHLAWWRLPEAREHEEQQAR